MRKLISVLFILVSTGVLFAEKIADLPEVMKPASMVIDGNTVYIADEGVVHIYTLNPVKKIGQFGSAGEGPGEFSSPPYVTVCSDHLFINSMGKVMFFSKEGQFMRQAKLPFVLWYFYYPLLPVGENYVGFPVLRQEDGSFIHVGNIYNAQYEFVKEIYRGDAPQVLPPPRPGTKVIKRDFAVIPNYIDVAVAEDKVFVADTRQGFFIAVFDQNGQLLYEIRKNYHKVKVPDEFKDTFWKELRESENYEDLKRRFNYVIRDDYPAFFSFKLADQKIYATTYEKKNQAYELVSLDLKGNILKRSLDFPLDPERKTLTGIASFSNEYVIQGNKIYFLVYNDDSSVFELHVHTILP